MYLKFLTDYLTALLTRLFPLIFVGLIKSAIWFLFISTKNMLFKKQALCIVHLSQGALKYR